MKSFEAKKYLPHIILVFCLITSTYFIFAPISVLAVTKDYIPLEPLPETTITGGGVTFQTYLPGIYKLGIGIAGVLAVLMITIGGIEYMVSEAISGKERAKQRIWNAVWGLLLAFISYAILYTINPKLVEFDLSLVQKPPQQTSPTPPPGSQIYTEACKTSLTLVPPRHLCQVMIVTTVGQRYCPPRTGYLAFRIGISAPNKYVCGGTIINDTINELCCRYDQK